MKYLKKYNESIKYEETTIPALVSDMEEYIKKNPKLKSLKKPISKTDMKHMARFIRLPEQQDGRTYKYKK